MSTRSNWPVNMLLPALTCCTWLTWRQRVTYAALAAVGPLVWTLVDFAVTGDPLFSLLYTSGSAEDLGRQRSLAIASAITIPLVEPEQRLDRYPEDRAYRGSHHFG